MPRRLKRRYHFYCCETSSSLSLDLPNENPNLLLRIFFTQSVKVAQQIKSKVPFINRALKHLSHSTGYLVRIYKLTNDCCINCLLQNSFQPDFLFSPYPKSLLIKQIRPIKTAI